MATNSNKKDFPEFFADLNSVESLRSQFIDTPMEGARLSAFSSGLDLVKVLSILPDAFVASQQSELERLQRSAEPGDSRIAFLEASIEEADVLRNTARQGQTRVQRLVVAMASGADVIHGFVSDDELNPLAGLTVRLSDNPAGAKGMSATTDADGYFSISLGGKKSRRVTEADMANITPEKVADLFSRPDEKQTAPGESASALRSEGQIQIVKKDKLIYEDPVPVPLDEGSVYREYVIQGG